MSWLVSLSESYDAILSINGKTNELEPYYHKKEPCHMEIIIDCKGNFLGANNLVEEVKFGDQKFWKGKSTIIPVTPKSLTGKTSGAAPYPLAEQIKYVAKDFLDFGEFKKNGKIKKSYFKEYLELLESWASDLKYSHYKVQAVAKYIAKGTVVHDLINLGLLYTYNEAGKTCLITDWQKHGQTSENQKGAIKQKSPPKPPLLRAISESEQGNVTIRWRVQTPGNPGDATWGDRELIEKWQNFQEKANSPNGFCQVEGVRRFISYTHPKGINPKANDAKIISTPTDKTYLTYQGRFTDEKQPCSISFKISNKSHNALKYLINTQGYRTGKQIYICWARSFKNIPEPFVSSYDLLENEMELSEIHEKNGYHELDHSADLGESFANRLKKWVRGYCQKEQLSPNEQILLLGLDSPTKGRLAIVFFRQLLASEYLERVERWHSEFAWFQRQSIGMSDSNRKNQSKNKIIWPIASPSPKSIEVAAYGRTIKNNNTLKMSVVERILPCIVDSRPFPKDILESVIRRVCNRNAKRLSENYSNLASEKAAWEKDLGVACALFCGYYQRHPNKQERRKFKMGLDEKRNNRNYLYGRLLAIAEYIEETAIRIADENRPTSAARLMQRFADRPFSTWRTIELGLQPYIQRLQANRTGFLVNRRKELDVVQSAFKPEDYTNDGPLTGEFLLGYHCQKQAWVRSTDKDIKTEGAQL